MYKYSFTLRNHLQLLFFSFVSFNLVVLACFIFYHTLILWFAIVFLLEINLHVIAPKYIIFINETICGNIYLHLEISYNSISFFLIIVLSCTYMLYIFSNTYFLNCNYILIPTQTLFKLY